MTTTRMKMKMMTMMMIWGLLVEVAALQLALGKNFWLSYSYGRLLCIGGAGGNRRERERGFWAGFAPKSMLHAIVLLASSLVCFAVARLRHNIVCFSPLLPPTSLLSLFPSFIQRSQWQISRTELSQNSRNSQRSISSCTQKLLRKTLMIFDKQDGKKKPERYMEYSI